MSTLDVIMARLKRADEHFEGLRALHNATVNEDFCRTALKPDRYKRAGNTRLVGRVISIDEFPVRYTLAIGDIAHSLRSALDNLAFAIVKPPAGAEKAVYFPICESPAKFAEDAKRKLPGVSRSVRAAFERLQPYHRRKMPLAKYLLHLNALNIWDKHRAITVCALNGVVARVRPDLDPRIEIVRQKLYPLRRLEPGAILATFDVRPRPGTPKGFQANVGMNPNLKIEVAFDKRMTPPLGGSNVLWVLKSCRRYIEFQVIPELGRFL